MIKDTLNSKGFTLIELLAVIVIFTLLLGIAVPAISDYVNENIDNTYVLHENSMKTAAANMMSECIQNDVNNCVPEKGESKNIYLKDLIDGQYLQDLKDPDKNDSYCNNIESYVVVTNKSNIANFEYKVCLICSSYESEACQVE